MRLTYIIVCRCLDGLPPLWYRGDAIVYALHCTVNALLVTHLHSTLADNYSLYYTRDSLPIKITVYGVFLLDVFQSLTVAVLGYYELCSGWGRPLKLLELNWTFSAVPFVTGLGEQPSSIFVRLHGMLTYSTH